MNHSFNEHEQVVKAILAGDELQAELLLRGHVAIQGQKFTDLIATLNLLSN
jgi:DNA-binding GntR family transcriptional regulator